MERKYLTEWKRFLNENLDQSYEQGVEYIKSKIKSLGMKLLDTDVITEPGFNRYKFYIASPYQRPADVKLSKIQDMSRKELKQAASIRIMWTYYYGESYSGGGYSLLDVSGEENLDPNKTGGTWTQSLKRDRGLPDDIIFSEKREQYSTSKIDTFLADIKKVIDTAPNKKDLKTISKAKKQYIKTNYPDGFQ